MQTSQCLLMIVFVVGLSTQVDGQAPARRLLPTNQPIEQRLLPDDKHVIIDLSPYPPLVVQVTDGEVIRSLVDGSDVCIFGTVVNKQSALNAARTSIYSTVSVRVQRLFQARSARPLKQGETIEFTQEGGTVQVGDVVVDGIFSWAKGFEVGRQYLIFARINVAGEIVTGPASSYELTDVFGLPRFRRLMMTSSSERNDVEELLSNEVFTRIEDRLRTKNAPF